MGEQRYLVYLLHSAAETEHEACDGWDTALSLASARIERIIDRGFVVMLRLGDEQTEEFPYCKWYIRSAADIATLAPDRPHERQT